MINNTQLQTYTAQLPAVPGVDPKQTEWLARVRQNPVRLMEHETARQEIAKAIISIAAYVAQPEDYVVTEFAKSFKEAYPNLNPMECAAAVKMQMTGKLGESDNRIFYAGKFNISTMFAILNEYLEWRKSVVAAIVIAEDEARREQERLKQKAAWIEAVEVDKAAFLRGEYGELASWEEIPVYWLKWANQAGLLTWEDGEAAALRDEAHRMAESETEHKNLASISDGRLEQVLKGERFLESIELRAKVIRSKLAVWRKLVNK